MNRFRIDGAVAVVTGAGGGIGATSATALAEAGADIALIGRTRTSLEEAALRVAAAGRQCAILEADVTDEESVGRAAAMSLDRFGKIDILFNNAGVTSATLLADLTLEEWRRVLDTNLTGAFLCARAFAPSMIERRRGRIINMGSIFSGRAAASRTAYAASKAGLANLGAALAFELGPYGITVNTIGASLTVTDLNRELIQTQPEFFRRIIDRTPLGRIGQVEDVAGLLVFLASPAAGFITGQTIFVDGGYTAG